MSVNRERPHIFILPEDEADADIANGFLLELKEGVNVRILPEAGGWSAAMDKFCNGELPGIRMYPGRFVVILIDFDGNGNRFQTLKDRVPSDVEDRVFIIGSKTKPEDLTKALRKSREQIGIELATDCREGKYDLWEHELLDNNREELVRLRKSLRPLLFE